MQCQVPFRLNPPLRAAVPLPRQRHSVRLAVENPTSGIGAAETRDRPILDGQHTWVTCRVSDNGLGIPPEQTAELFELYKWGTQAHRTQGLGIGLYLCRQIIQAHGGEIGVCSHAGGTTFWFTLPTIAQGDRVIPD
ncbi:sensor histidine kinase [Trichothermofontia sp.]